MAGFTPEDINSYVDDLIDSSWSDATSSSTSSCDKKDILKECFKHSYIIDHYEGFEFIDEGGCGAVYKAKHKIDKKCYALKFILIHSVGEREVLLREAETLAAITNENVIRYHTSHLIKLNGHGSSPKTGISDDPDVEFANSREAYLDIHRDTKQNSFSSSSESSESDTKVMNEGNKSTRSDQESSSASGQSMGSSVTECLIIKMELCNCAKTLKEMIIVPNSKVFSKEFVRNQIVRGIINGLRSIHDAGIMHRDLKPANIFLDSNDTVKIGDFGFARHYIQLAEDASSPSSKENAKRYRGFTKELGTKPYVAPEVDTGHVYSKCVDIYSLGIILFELYYKMDSAHERKKVMDSLTKPTVEFPDDFGEKCGSKLSHIEPVLRRMLDHDAAQRCHLDELEGLLFRKEEDLAISESVVPPVPQEQGDGPHAFVRQQRKRSSIRRQISEPASSTSSFDAEEETFQVQQQMDAMQIRVHTGKHMLMQDNDIQ